MLRRFWKVPQLLFASSILLANGCIHSPRADLQAAEADYKLAKRYEHGDGVSKNLETAAKYLQLSAEQGCVYAETDLGSYYARGIGVQKDFSQAFYWYHKAADSKDPLAEYCIGYAYANGDGVARDLNQAIQWWRQSAEHGQAEAENALGQLYFHGEGPGKTNYINYAESARWLGKAAVQNYVPAMNNLAFMYQNGFGVQKNLSNAFHWYQVAANEGDGEAQANLGLMYQDGSAVPHDMVQAYKWFAISAEQGNILGKHFFDDYNEYQRLTPDQFAKARQMVAEFNSKHAQKNNSAPEVKP